MLQQAYWRYFLGAFVFFAVTILIVIILNPIIGIFSWIIGGILGLLFANGLANYFDMKYGSDRDRLQYREAKQGNLIHEPIELDTSKCLSCMHVIQPEDNHCPNCGFNLKRMKSSNRNTSQD